MIYTSGQSRRSSVLSTIVSRSTCKIHVRSFLCCGQFLFRLFIHRLSILFSPHFNEFRRGHYYKLYLTTCRLNVRSNSFSQRVIQNGTHSQVTLILHHLKDFINLSPLKFYSHTARYFYLVGCLAYTQYNVFCIRYTCVF